MRYPSKQTMWMLYLKWCPTLQINSSGRTKRADATRPYQARFYNTTLIFLLFLEKTYQITEIFCIRNYVCASSKIRIYSFAAACMPVRASCSAASFV